ncbi:unnamed protein product [Bursaphelenchus xylophilus]|uniref:Pre-mRNA-splicing factor 38 n=1 Tax=Bursaphelenchus xylophilus TaxID=6326 RepID=A0A1I7SDE6_BURXY|nr:unnamed protein product [Bursaphelenchus xylophilus]CAG9130639.1 unnamed protein product [Bursaphelenchus xylophilus]
MDLQDTPANFKELMGFEARNEAVYDEESNGSVPNIQKITKGNNVLPLWGNLATMNLNTLLLENVVQSAYYKNVLTELTNFQQVVDQILHKVTHLEPWERGTRKTFGMGGMCGGVRGVGAGGVISTCFCVLYKLFALKLTRKQLVSMINSTQSIMMRGVGFLYIRYTQPPSDFWWWFEPYLDDTEEIDPKAGGGDYQTVGDFVRTLLSKLDWYGTLFPRIPVPIQKDIDAKLHPRHQRESPRETVRERSREVKDRPIKKTRCAHHLRHHHCRKHRKRCPRKVQAETKLEE